jgi:hypothetical protein
MLNAPLSINTINNMKTKNLKISYFKILFICIISFSFIAFLSGCDDTDIPFMVDADINHFEFANMVDSAKINKLARTIYAELDEAENIETVIPSFVLSHGATAYVNDVEQISGVSPLNFSKTITYKIVSGDKSYSAEWEVTIAKRYVEHQSDFSGELTTNLVLSAGTYLVKEDVIVNQGIYFAIEPGVIIQFAPCTKIIFNDNDLFTAKGTAANPIRFMSANSSIDDPNASWGGIEFNNSSAELEHCEFVNGGCNNAPMIYLHNTTLGIKNSSFQNSKYTGIYLDNNSTFRTFINNQMSNCGEFVDGCYPIHFVDFNKIVNLQGGNNIQTSKGIFIEKSNMTNSITLIGQTCPFIFQDNITASVSGLAFFLQPGVSILMKEGKGINIGNSSTIKFIAQGSAEYPVNFMGETNTPGCWEGISLGGETLTGSFFEFCNINYAGNGGNSGAIKCMNTSTDKLSITNCKISNTNSHGIYFGSGASATMEGNAFNNIPSAFQDIYNE